MDSGFRSLIVLTLCVSLAACTTWREVPRWQPTVESSRPTISPDLEPGDRITVTTTDGQKAEVVFVALTAEALEGTVGKDRQSVQIPRAQIVLVERREFSALKTTGLVASVLLVTLLALLAIALSSYAAMP